MLGHPGSYPWAQHFKTDIIICILACILNVLCATNVNMPIPLAQAMVYSLIGKLLVLLERKLQLISLAHDLSQHHTPHVEFLALTCIYTMTNLVKISQIFEKSSYRVATSFEQTWLSQYPQPMWVICDNGEEFTGVAFKKMLCLLNIKPVPTMNTNL